MFTLQKRNLLNKTYDGARYAKYLPSGDNVGEMFSGLPNNTSRGISSSDVVRLVANMLVFGAQLILDLCFVIDIGDIKAEVNRGENNIAMYATMCALL